MAESNADSTGFNRREFIKGGSFATLMTMLGGVELFAQTNQEPAAETKPAASKIKCAVIGLGPWGREILDQLGRLPQAEVVAICDNYPAMLKRSATKAPAAAPTRQTPTYQICHPWYPDSRCQVTAWSLIGR